MNRAACVLLVAALAGIAITFPATAVATATHTPVKGSAERTAILAALRGVVKKMSGLDVIFVVTHIKVKDDWAWVVAEPQSRDGTQHYETMSGLLRRQDKRWVYVEGPPEAVTCDEDPDCRDPNRYFLGLAKKYPVLSPDIFR